MTTVILATLTWVLLSLPAAALLGRAIRVADETVEASFGTDSAERYLAEQAPAPSR